VLLAATSQHRRIIWLFRPFAGSPLACSPSGFFAPWLIRPLAFSPLGLFAPWPGRVFNSEYSGRHDFQAKKFERQCTKSGSHAVGIQEKSSKNSMQYNTYYICVTYAPPT